MIAAACLKTRPLALFTSNAVTIFAAVTAPITECSDCAQPGGLGRRLLQKSLIIHEPIILSYHRNQSRAYMIILKSPEMVLISVSGEIGVQYINNEIITELLMKI